MASPNPDFLPGNEPQLTDSERAALEGFDDNGNAVAAAPAPAADAPAPDSETPPAPEATPKAEDPAAPAPAPVVAPVEAPAPAPVAATPAVAPTPTHSPIFTPQINPGEKRDFAAELTALKTKYQNGEIADDDLYESQRDAILEARTLFNAQAAIAEQLSEQGWQANVNVFLQQAENAALHRSPEMKDLWQAMMARVVNEAAASGQHLGDWEILTNGRNLLFQTLGISTAPPPAAETPAPPPAPAAPPKPNQAPPLANVPPTLGNAPAAAPSGAKTTAESLAGSNSVLDIEQFMATQSEEANDALLRSLPGAFAD